MLDDESITLEVVTENIPVPQDPEAREALTEFMKAPDAGSSAMAARHVEITPEIAEIWLKTNRKNRPLRKDWVARLARDIKDGLWQASGQTIIFDANGMLIDGQHRLAACVQAGQAIASMVVWGARPDAAFRVIDSGHIRTVSELLGLHKALTAAMRYQWKYREGNSLQSSGIPTASAPQVYNLYLENPILWDEAEKCRLGAKAAGFLTRALPVWMYYEMAMVDKRLADLFFEALYTGPALRHSHHPIESVKAYFLSPGRHTLTINEMAWCTFKAWDYWVTGKTAPKDWGWTEKYRSAQTAAQPSDKRSLLLPTPPQAHSSTVWVS